MNSISTRNLENMPDIPNLKSLMQSIAVLDLIISPEWEYRYYSFNSFWDKSETMGSMRNGQGDELIVLFNEKGCFIKGFAHESTMSSWNTNKQKPWPGVLDGVPAEFSKALIEPAFSMENISFCIWKLNTDSTWSCGSIEFPDSEYIDGSADLLEIFDGKPETYKIFSDEYFEKNIPLNIVCDIYNHKPLDDKMISTLNDETSISEIKAELIEIGYSNEK